MVVEIILSAHGYRVLPAARGEQALEIADAHADAIDVLVTDFQLPQMTGRDLIRVLKEKVPRLQVLVLSGHPADGLPGPPLPDDCAFLRKPFSDIDLVETIEHLLERPPA
jgi:two-component system, cell cycle sensor histidine kinase and response regulator CckA